MNPDQDTRDTVRSKDVPKDFQNVALSDGNSNGSRGIRKKVKDEHLLEENCP